MIPCRVFAYYVLALAIAWAGWVPFAAYQAGILPVAVPIEVPLFAQFGPSLAGILLVGYEGGWAGLRRFLRTSLRWRLALRWYFVALLLTPVIAAIGLVVHAALGDTVPSAADLRGWLSVYAQSFGTGGPYALSRSLPPSMGLISMLRGLVAESPLWAVVNFVIFAVFTGPVSEEFGWRGYALPRLQGANSALKASVIVGLLWGFWHTGPDFWRILLQGNPLAILYPLAITMGTIPLSIVSTWLYNNVRGSLLPSMLLHASFNETLYVLALVWNGRSSIVLGAELVLGVCLFVVIGLVYYGPKTLSGSGDDGVAVSAA
jgi:membrane protease YdiL (CAAX protease family)